MQTTSDADFQATVLDSELPVLVDFFAPWCGPCRALAPLLEELEDEVAGKMKIVKMNVDENASIAEQLGVRSVPTLVLFKGGAPKEGAVGLVAKSRLRELVAKHIGESV